MINNFSLSIIITICTKLKNNISFFSDPAVRNNVKSNVIQNIQDQGVCRVPDPGRYPWTDLNPGLNLDQSPDPGREPALEPALEVVLEVKKN